MWTQQWLSHNLYFVLILPEAAEDLALNLVEDLTTHTTFSGGGGHPSLFSSTVKQVRHDAIVFNIHLETSGFYTVIRHWCLSL